LHCGVRSVIYWRTCNHLVSAGGLQEDKFPKGLQALEPEAQMKAEYMKIPTGQTTSKRYNRPGLRVATCAECGARIESGSFADKKLGGYKDRENRDICTRCAEAITEIDMKNVEGRTT
jgi:ribosomal protein L34E